LGTRRERGIWYGSEEVQTALAETAYYRLLFIEGSEADLGTVETRHTVFRGSVKTGRGVDLTTGAYAEHREAIASPTSYATSQALGGAMREAEVELARFPSARGAPEGINVAVFSPNAFTLKNPTHLNDWYCVTQSDRVEFTKVDRLKSEGYNFSREFFLVEGPASGGLPAPAV